MRQKRYPAIHLRDHHRAAPFQQSDLPRNQLRALNPRGCSVASKMSPARIATRTRLPAAA